MSSSFVINRKHSLNRGLLAWWMVLPHYNGGNTWIDLAQNNKNASLHNLNTADNNSGWKNFTHKGANGSLQFNGSNTYVQTPTFGIFDNTKSWTLSIWVYLLSTGQQMIFQSRGERDTALVINGGFYQYFWYAGNIVGPTSLSNVTTNIWTHLVAVWNTSNNTLKLYRDSIYQGSSPTGTASTVSDINCFGSQFYSGTNHENLNGYLDDGRIWNRPLDDNEVQSVYNNSLQGYPGLFKKTARNQYMKFTTSPSIVSSTPRRVLLGTVFRSPVIT